MFRRLTQYIKDRTTSHDVVDFGHFKLHINPRDVGGRAYRSSSYRDELLCTLQREIVRNVQPVAYIDIGANYGFTALAHHYFNPKARIIAVEPSPVLLPILTKNLSVVPPALLEIVPAICGANEDKAVEFAINPTHSQDSRVKGEPGWRTTSVQSTTLSALMAKHAPQGRIYIKIDTQGFEESVFAGAAGLDKRNDWIIKTEFAPTWLIKHGTNPAAFLEGLCRRYTVCELSKRTRFKADSLEQLKRGALKSEEAAPFVNYIQSLSGGEGWCDLLILPHNHGK
jgi:FkbM family methyltransferase